jgi:voltage-gated potassium channel
MPRKRRTHNFIFELFRIYRIQRFLMVQFGLILISAGLTPLFESGHEGANILTFADGLWWALVTATSTGYGDYVPVTWEGRTLGTVLMFSGIMLFSMTIALVASYFSNRRMMRNTMRLEGRLERIEEGVVDLGKKVDFLVKERV